MELAIKMRCRKEMINISDYKEVDIDPEIEIAKFIHYLFDEEYCEKNNVNIIYTAFFDISHKEHSMLEIIGQYQRDMAPIYTMGNQTQSQIKLNSIKFAGSIKTLCGLPITNNNKLYFTIKKENRLIDFYLKDVETLDEIYPYTYRFITHGGVIGNHVLEENHDGQIYNSYTEKWSWF